MTKLLWVLSTFIALSLLASGAVPFISRIRNGGGVSLGAALILGSFVVLAFAGLAGVLAQRWAKSVLVGSLLMCSVGFALRAFDL